MAIFNSYVCLPEGIYIYMLRSSTGGSAMDDTYCLSQTGSILKLPTCPGKGVVGRKEDFRPHGFSWMVVPPLVIVTDM